MKIFVTGGSGFIGRRLVDKLSKDKNNQIFCLTRDLTKIQISSEENIQYVEGDLIKPQTYEKFLQECDVVYHMAAYVSYGIRGKERKIMEQTNIEGTKMVFSLAEKSRISKIIYLSSAMIYHPTNEVIVQESHNITNKHTTHYSRTKYLGYLEAQKFIKRGLPIIVILPTSVYGQGSPLFSDFFNFLRKFRVIFKDLLNKKISIVYVDDVIEGILQAGKSSYLGQSFILSSEIVTMGNLVEIFEEHFKIRIHKISIPKFISKTLFFLLNLLSQSIRKKLYINNEIYNFINGNFTASGDKAKKMLNWKTSDFNDKFIETFCLN